MQIASCWPNKPPISQHWQIFDPYAFPAIEHGVTTVVPGNCSLSLAPLREEQRDSFSRMFRLIEEMPEAAFEAGVDWSWGEGFGGWGTPAVHQWNDDDAAGRACGISADGDYYP